MEAPEKIYLNPIHDALTEMLSTKIDGDIEYVRTDALIKKMQDWIKNRAESFIVDTPLFPYFDYKKAIENFKEYMEE